MAIENGGAAKTPREHFTRDANDELPEIKERTFQQSAQYRGVQPTEARTQLLAPADIWRDI